MKKERRISLNRKFIFASAILAIILTLSVTLVSYILYRDSMLKEYSRDLTTMIGLSEALIVPDEVNTLLKNPSEAKESKRYKELKNQFMNIQQNTDLNYIHVYVPQENGFTIFVQGTQVDEEDNYEIGDFKEYENEEQKKYLFNLMKNPGTLDIQTVQGFFGYMITGNYSIEGSNGQAVGIISAYMSMNDMTTTLSRYFKFIILIVGSIFLAFIIVYLVALKRQIISPLQVLINSAQQFVNTDYSEKGVSITGINVNIKTGDEIQDLADAFNKMTEDIAKYVKELTEATSEKQRIQTELHIAALIQESMLPNIFPAFPQRKDFDVYAFMRAAKNVGGDFYDFFLIDKQHLCFLIGDVSDKGVPAALFMAMTKANIKDFAMQNLSVEEIIYRTNNLLCKNNEQNMFVTIYVAILDLQTGKMDFCNAGHSNAILWHSDGTTTEIKSKKSFVVGAYSDYPYKPNTVNIKKGDIIYLYTDGVSEAINPEKQMYTEKRIYDFIAKQESRDMKKLCEDIVLDVDKFAGKEPQFDDMTMIAVKWCGEQDEN